MFDDHDGDFQISEENTPPGRMRERLSAFFGQEQNGRGIVNYNKVAYKRIRALLTISSSYRVPN